MEVNRDQKVFGLANIRQNIFSVWIQIFYKGEPEAAWLLTFVKISEFNKFGTSFLGELAL